MKIFFKTALISAVVVLITLCFASPIFAIPNGFDEFGYNYKARIFVDNADGSDKKLDGAVWVNIRLNFYPKIVC